jgi:hypothetical protein
VKKALFAIAVFLTVCGIAASAAEPARPSAKSRAPGGKVTTARPLPPDYMLRARAKSRATRTDAVPPSKPLDPEKVIPKRELVFDQSDEEYPLTADPAQYGPKFVELLQDRYVVILNLQFRNRRVNAPPRNASERDLQSYSGVWNMRFQDPAQLASKVPQGRVPSAEIMGMLTRSKYVQLGNARQTEEDRATPDVGPVALYTRKLDFELTLTAPTAERAKELAQAMLALYDYGYSLAAHQAYADLYEYWKSQLSDELADVKPMQETLAAEEKELESLKPYEEITSEALASLVSQKQLNIVERAGVLARITACQKILDQIKKNARPFATQAEKAETVKIAAEIELAGLEAKQAAIDDLVQKSRRRIDLVREVGSLKSNLSDHAGVAMSLEERAEGYKTAIEEKMPFAKVGGKVLVRRIKWEQPKPAAKQ